MTETNAMTYADAMAIWSDTAAWAQMVITDSRLQMVAEMRLYAPDMADSSKNWPDMALALTDGS